MVAYLYLNFCWFFNFVHAFILGFLSSLFFGIRQIYIVSIFFGYHFMILIIGIGQVWIFYIIYTSHKIFQLPKPLRSPPSIQMQLPKLPKVSKKLTHRFFLVENRFKIPPKAKRIKSIKILTDDWPVQDLYQKPKAAVLCRVLFIYTGVFLICHKYSNFWRKCRLNRTYPPYVYSNYRKRIPA